MKHLTAEDIAAAVPSLGGREIGPFLRSLARRVPDNSHVVELGAWLGAGSAQLAMGLSERRGSGAAVLSCYDRWAAPTPDETAIAAAQGLDLIAGMNTLPLAEETLASIPAEIRYHRGDIAAARWNGEPIALYVDHIGDDVQTARHALRTFGPSWMAGHCVVVFMDMSEPPEVAAARGCPRARLVLDNPENFREVFVDLGDHGRAWFYARPVEFTALGSIG